MRVPNPKESCWGGHEQLSAVSLGPLLLNLSLAWLRGASRSLCGNIKDSADGQSIHREPNQSLIQGD